MAEDKKKKSNVHSLNKAGHEANMRRVSKRKKAYNARKKLRRASGARYDNKSSNSEYVESKNEAKLYGKKVARDKAILKKKGSKLSHEAITELKRKVEVGGYIGKDMGDDKKKILKEDTIKRTKQVKAEKAHAKTVAKRKAVEKALPPKLTKGQSAKLRLAKRRRGMIGQPIGGGRRNPNLKK